MATLDKNVLRKAFRATTNSIRMVPNFIIIGAQKGGTTSLYRYLIEHPNIAPIYVKEPHFFDIYYHKGLGWYRSHFPTAVEKYYARCVEKHDLITGEASPYYLFHPSAAQRVAKTLPKAKLIALLRNPIDRAYSQYQHQLRQPGEEERLRQNEKYASFNHRHYSYLARSTYINQLPAWLDIFPREQLLILKSEDLYADPASIVKQTLEHLSVPVSTQQRAYKPFNEAKYTPMNPETRARLVEYFKPYNARLYDLLGRDFGWDK